MKELRLLGAVCASVITSLFPSIGEGVAIGPGGNAYEYVPFYNIAYSDAKIAAEASSYFGTAGHLATIFNQEENDFIRDLLVGVDNSAWLGGSDATVEGQWEWVTGETFWQGGIRGDVGPDIAYANWLPEREPNNTQITNLGEDYLTMFGLSVPAGSDSQPGFWNDLGSPGFTREEFIVGGYVVEYEGDYVVESEVSTIPLPPALWLFGSGFLGLIGIARRKKAA